MEYKFVLSLALYQEMMTDFHVNKVNICSFIILALSDKGRKKCHVDSLKKKFSETTHCTAPWHQAH